MVYTLPTSNAVGCPIKTYINKALNRTKAKLTKK